MAYSESVAGVSSAGTVKARASEGLELTEEGRTAHASVSQRVMATRQTLRRGITDEEYVKVVSVLQRMASNLETEP